MIYFLCTEQNKAGWKKVSDSEDVERNYKGACAALPFVQDPAEWLQTISEGNNIASHGQKCLNDGIMMTETVEAFHVWLLSVSR